LILSIRVAEQVNFVPEIIDRLHVSAESEACRMMKIEIPNSRRTGSNGLQWKEEADKFSQKQMEDSISIAAVHIVGGQVNDTDDILKISDPMSTLHFRDVSRQECFKASSSCFEAIWNDSHDMSFLHECDGGGPLELHCRFQRQQDKEQMSHLRSLAFSSGLISSMEVRTCATGHGNSFHVKSLALAT
jgi:hypothetical protein